MIQTHPFDALRKAKTREEFDTLLEGLLISLLPGSVVDLPEGKWMAYIIDTGKRLIDKGLGIEFNNNYTRIRKLESF